MKRFLVLAAVAWAATAAAQEAPGVHVEPASVQPGQPISFLLVFPDDATGDAVLEVGDGRTETVNAAVGEVDLPLDAPERPGSYTARLTYQTPGGTQHHEADYTVEGDQGAPLPAWSIFVLLPLAAVLRR